MWNTLHSRYYSCVHVSGVSIIITKPKIYHPVLHGKPHSQTPQVSPAENNKYEIQMLYKCSREKNCFLVVKRLKHLNGINIHENTPEYKKQRDGIRISHRYLHYHKNNPLRAYTLQFLLLLAFKQSFRIFL